MLRVHYLMQNLAKMSITFKYATASNASPLTIDLFLFYKVLITLATFQGNPTDLAVLNILLLHLLIYYLTMSLRINSRRDGHSSSCFHNPRSSS